MKDRLELPNFTTCLVIQADNPKDSNFVLIILFIFSKIG